MKTFTRLLKWILKAVIFFALFAFALNNQQDVIVHFFLGRQWHAPLVVVLLISFALGIALGALGMMPHWWKQRAQRRSVGAGSGATQESPRALESSVVRSDGH